MRLSAAIAGVIVTLLHFPPSPAAAQIGPTQQRCQKALLAATARFTTTTQRHLRKSIESNLKGKSSPCDGGFACIGGASHGRGCATNLDCGGTGPIPGCYPLASKGLAGALNAAGRRLRNNIARSCTNAGVIPADLGFPTEACPAPTGSAMTFDDVVDCILRPAAGDVDGAQVVGAHSEPLARAVGNVPVATPSDVCGLTLSSVLQIGSRDRGSTVGTSGPTVHLDVTCSDNVCDTSGAIPVGNLSGPPIEVLVGSLSFCLVTRLGDAGNGTSEMGQIDLDTGYQRSYAPIVTDVHAGPCPTCADGLCDAGPNAGQRCVNPGSPDIGCQPTASSRFASIPNPLDLDTESETLTKIDGKPGICGFCSTSIAIGCQVDGDCPGGETCDYSATQPGFHGDAAATTVSVDGRRGPYMPHLGGVFCTGRTNNALVDSMLTGLPGPVRYVLVKVNAFTFPP